MQRLRAPFQRERRELRRPAPEKSSAASRSSTASSWHCPYTRLQPTQHSCVPAVGLSSAKIGYFGLSILWRAAVQPWRMFDGDATSVTLDPAHLERVRGYLAGETDFPDDTLAITVTVATDFLRRTPASFPAG